MNFIRLKSLMILIFITTFTGCFLKKTSIDSKIAVPQIPIFIEMPKNYLVFENLSSILYETLYNHFQRVGYNLTCNRKNSFVLSIKLKKFEEAMRLVSPDVLTFGFRADFILELKLISPEKQVIVEKNFEINKYVFKAKDPIYNQLFLNEQYKQLFERTAPKIDLYLRRFFRDQK